MSAEQYHPRLTWDQAKACTSFWSSDSRTHWTWNLISTFWHKYTRSLAPNTKLLLGDQLEPPIATIKDDVTRWQCDSAASGLLFLQWSVFFCKVYHSFSFKVLFSPGALLLCLFSFYFYFCLKIHGNLSHSWIVPTNLWNRKIRGWKPLVVPTTPGNTTACLLFYSLN